MWYNAARMAQDTGLLQVAEARERLLASLAPLPAEQVKLMDSLGRVLVGDIAAAFDLPPFPNSGMDGFAVRAADIAAARSGAPVTLPVVADIPAGQTPTLALQAGQAMRIMTGAVLPQGADAVAPVENTDFALFRHSGMPLPSQVRIFSPEKVGSNVRPAGQDVRTGEIVLHSGQALRPQDVGLLATLGQEWVTVARRPRVAVFSSGDELLPAGAPLLPGKIYDSNTYTLTALAHYAGAEPLNLGVAADTPQAVERVLERAVQAGVDMILSSAGVSVGAFDFVRSVVEANGRLDFWRVNMRPGKPIAFGTYRDIPFLGLPGNPVSAFMGFEVFVRPALLFMQGAAQIYRPTMKVKLGEDIESDGRESYLRVRIERQAAGYVATLTGHQGSGNLRSLVQANALLFVPSGVKSLPTGAEATIWLLDPLPQ